MYKMSVIKNSKGNVFLFVLIVAGVLGLFALAMSGSIKDYLTRQSRANATANYKQFMSNIENLIQDPAFCRQILGGGNNIVDTSGNWQAAQVILKQAGTTQNLLIQNNVQLANIGLDIKTVAIKLESAERYTNSNGVINSQRKIFYHYPGTGALNSGPYIKAKFRLRVVPTNFPFQELDSNKEFDIEFFGKYRIQTIGSTVNRLYDCHGTKSIAQVCEIAGGAYDVTFSPREYRCNPDLVCRNSEQGVRNCSSISCSGPFKVMYLSPTLCICQWCNQSRNEP